MQLGAVIILYNIPWYNLQHCNLSNRTQIRFWTHKGHSISHPLVRCGFQETKRLHYDCIAMNIVGHKMKGNALIKYKDEECNLKWLGSISNWLIQRYVTHILFSLPFGLSGRRDVVVACVCLSVRLSVNPWTLLFPHDNWSPIWTSITNFAINMHPETLSVGIENRSHSFRSSWSFWPFGLESPNLRQICIMGYSQLVFKIGVIDLDIQGNFGHFDSEF